MNSMTLALWLTGCGGFLLGYLVRGLLCSDDALVERLSRRVRQLEAERSRVAGIRGL